MKERFEKKNFREKSLAIIAAATTIIDEYDAQGFSLTLRQLYYQFVARDLLPNTERSYKNLGSLISDARLAGLIDWEAIVDRTRNLRSNSHWISGADMLETCVNQFQTDRWAKQPYRVEVWIEKDALIGVIEDVCERLDVPYFACRGYNSQSEQWAAGKRFYHYIRNGQDPVVLHLGDHDPSGIDMTRDNDDRLTMFAHWGNVEVKRLALNMDQVEQYGPPPNPTKLTDSRAPDYVQRYGYECWELDALEPRVMANLIETNILALRDDDLWQQSEEYEQSVKDKLSEYSDQMEQDGL